MMSFCAWQVYLYAQNMYTILPKTSQLIHIFEGILKHMLFDDIHVFIRPKDGFLNVQFCS